ncbi:MAG: methyltransferase domain-containing protein [Myxococcales bacterium]|nr:MAG: methyltransferase domain-containing protein [Myxococcales bacterium]
MSNPADLPLDPRSLDVGGATDRLPGAIRIDLDPRSRADVNHDLDVVPWPFPDSTFEFVRAFDVLDHVVDLEGCLKELHRICQPGAAIHVRLPFLKGLRLASDPAQRLVATSRTFDPFDPTRGPGLGHAGAPFRLVAVHYERGYTSSRLGRALARVDRRLLPFLERHMVGYELCFARLYPMHKVYYELRVVKGT